MEINIESEIYSFEFIEDSNVWVLLKDHHIEIGSFDIELEIYLNKLPDNEVDWADVQKFIMFLKYYNTVILDKISLGNTMLQEFQKLLYKDIMEEGWLNAIYFSPSCFEYTGYRNNSFYYSINYYFQSHSDDDVYSTSSWYAHFIDDKLVGISRTI